MKQFPKVNIVILNYNGKNYLKECLSSVFCLDYSNFEVVVVDNNSDDGSLEMAKQYFPKAVFIKNEANLGFSAGNNIGIKYSLEKMAEFVLLLNNDTCVEKLLLTELIETMRINKKVGLASPLIFSGNSDNIWFSGGRIDWLKMKAIHTDRATDFISGCAMLVSADVFKKIGLLDEDFFLYWEDVDFSVRAKQAGFSILIVKDSSVWHFEKSEKNKKNKIYWLVFSGLLFFHKNTPKYLRPWISFFILLRKSKNRLDLWKNKKNEIAPIVRKAYNDFKKFKCKQ
jgi:GT2 family glycosyltransferase